MPIYIGWSEMCSFGAHSDSKIIMPFFVEIITFLKLKSLFLHKPIKKIIIDFKNHYC